MIKDSSLSRNHGDWFQAVESGEERFGEFFSYGLSLLGLPASEMVEMIGLVSLLTVIYIFTKSWRPIAIAFGILVLLAFLGLGGGNI